jgi:hypothetical protein
MLEDRRGRVSQLGIRTHKTAAAARSEVDPDFAARCVEQRRLHQSLAQRAEHRLLPHVAAVRQQAGADGRPLVARRRVDAATKTFRSPEESVFNPMLSHLRPGAQRPPHPVMTAVDWLWHERCQQGGA